MPSWLRHSRLLTLFLQIPCPLCQRPASQEFCPTCQRYLRQQQIAHPEKFWASQAVFAWGHYGGNLSAAIAALKYTNAPYLARPLGQWLAQAWLTARLEPAPYIIVPIPMHADKQQQRGYNQAELLARSFCQFTGDRLCSQGLARTRATEAQFNLPAAQREQNLHQAFQVGADFVRRPPRQPVLLLDDIYTTGATARAAMQTLRHQGIAVRGLITIAKAELRQTARHVPPSPPVRSPTGGQQQD